MEKNAIVDMHNETTIHGSMGSVTIQVANTVIVNNIVENLMEKGNGRECRRSEKMLMLVESQFKKLDYLKENGQDEMP